LRTNPQLSLAPWHGADSCRRYLVEVAIPVYLDGHMSFEITTRPEAAFVVMLAVALTVYLGAPPAWHADLAQTECEHLVVERLDGQPGDATAQWEILPSAHWECYSDARPIASLGWRVRESASDDAELDGE
jgi:hypothetical protein